jgi:hypothetical protein
MTEPLKLEPDRQPSATPAPGDWTFLLKVLGISLLLAVVIKTVGPRLPIGATNLNATLAILTPSLLAALIFIVRSFRS